MLSPNRSRDDRRADRAEQDPEDRDADLNRADEPHWLVHELERRPRSATSALGPRLETAPPRSDERVLGRHEDRVAEHEQQHGDNTERLVHAPFSGAQVLGGSSSSKMVRPQYRRARRLYHRAAMEPDLDLIRGRSAPSRARSSR